MKGWKGPCYLITDGHYKTFEDLMTQTPWESYGPGNDPRCEHCMMHCGFEPSAAYGINVELRRQLEDAGMDAALAPRPRSDARQSSTRARASSACATTQ